MDAQADLRLCYSHMAKTGFLMKWPILFNQIKYEVKGVSWQFVGYDVLEGLSIK